MTRSRLAGFTALVITFSFMTIVEAEQWSRFRGPNGKGVSTAATIPIRWTERDFDWKIDIPGLGHSSPVVWDDRIFLTSGDRSTGKRLVLCIDAHTGKTIWQKEYGARSYKMHRRNSVSTSTPAVDAEHVYLAWATPDQCMLLALDREGKQVWKKELGKYNGNHGFGVSPIVYEDLVILANDQNKKGYLLAVDRKTGEQRWKIARQSGNETYATPCVYRPKNGPGQIIFTNWKLGMTSVDPKSGAINWELSIFEPNKKERSIASPVVAGDLILGTCGFVTAQKHFVAVRPGDANGGEPKEVWRIERSVSYLPTPLVVGRRIFLCTEKGIASCVNAEDGKVVWQERLDGEFYASPVCAGEHIYCTSTDGEVFVLKASDRFKALARNSLGDATQSTPAIANGRIYFRTHSHLISLGGKG